jgi:hypothetical protein
MRKITFYLAMISILFVRCDSGSGTIEVDDSTLNAESISGSWEVIGDATDEFTSFSFTESLSYTIVDAYDDTYSGSYTINDEDETISLEDFGLIDNCDINGDYFNFGLQIYEKSISSYYEITTMRIDEDDDDGNGGTDNPSNHITAGEYTADVLIREPYPNIMYGYNPDEGVGLIKIVLVSEVFGDDDEIIVEVRLGCVAPTSIDDVIGTHELGDHDYDLDCENVVKVWGTTCYRGTINISKDGDTWTVSSDDLVNDDDIECSFYYNGIMYDGNY